MNCPEGREQSTQAITLLAASEILREDEHHRQANLLPTLQRQAARHCAPEQKALSVM